MEVAQTILLGRFDLLEEVGEGSFGRVFRAYDRVLQRPVALKQFFGHASRSEFSSHKREMEVLAHLDHPALVKVYDLVLDPSSGVRYLSQDFVEGHSLKRFLVESDWEARIAVFVQLLHGLEYLHQRGLVHLDIKPSNVLVESGPPDQGKAPSAKILDFGVADKIGEFEKRGLIAGTFPYIAPEVVRQENVDGRADLYSLAMIYFKLACGGKTSSRAQDAPTTQGTPRSTSTIDDLIRDTRDRKAPVPDQFDSDVPEPMRDILIALLDPEPRRRFWSANDVIRRINGRTGSRFPLEPGHLRLPDRATALMTGRASEFREVKAWADELRASEKARFLGLIQGRGQSGKTALLDEFRRWAEMQDLYVVALMRENEGPPELFERLLAESGGAEEIEPFEPYLKGLLPTRYGDAPEPIILETTPELQKAQSLVMQGKALAYLLRGRPMALLIDDLDRKPELAEILAAALMIHSDETYSIPGGAAGKLLVLIGSTNPLPAAIPADRVLEMKNWNRDQAVSVVRQLLAVEDPPSQLVDTLMGKTEGVPGLLIEYLRLFCHEFLAVGEDVQAQVEVVDWRGLGGALNLASWHSEEIRALDTTERSILTWLSLLPSELTAQDLTTLHPELAAGALQSLRRLRDRGWLAEGIRGFQLSSPLRRDAVLHGADSEDRRRRHLLLAEKWSLLSVARLESGSTLAHAEQFFRGGDVARGFQLAERELQTLLRWNQPEPVATFLEAHLAWAGLLAEPSARSYRRLLAQAYLSTGRFPAAIEIYHSLAQGTQDQDEEADATVHLARAMRFGGKLDEAARTIRAFKERATDGGRWAASLDSLYADILLEQSRYAEASAISRPYLSGETSCGADERLAFRHIQAKVHFYSKETDQAIELFKQNCAEGRRSGRQARYALSLNALGAAYLVKNDLDAAIQCLHSCATLSQEIGDLRGMALANLNLGVAYQKLGSGDSAEHYYGKALVVFRKIGADTERARALYNLAMFRRTRGNLEGAAEAADEAMRLSISLGMEHLAAKVSMEKAECRLACGRWKESWVEAALAENRFLALNMPPESLEARLIGIEARLKSGDTASAQAALAESHEALSREDHPDIQVRLAALKAALTAATASHASPAVGTPPVIQPGLSERSSEPTLLNSSALDRAPASATVIAAVQVPAQRRRTDRESPALLALIHKINSPLHLQDTLISIVDEIVSFTGAERGFLLLSEEGRLVVRLARFWDHREVPNPTEHFSLSVAEATVAQGRPTISRDVATDPRFNDAGSVKQLCLKSVLAMPLFAQGGTIGALYLDTQSREGRFHEQDVPLLSTLGELTALAIIKAQLITQSIRDQRELRKTVKELNLSKTRIQSLVGELEEANRRLHDQVTHQQIELDATRRKVEFLTQDSPPKYSYDKIVGSSPAIRRLFGLLDRAVDSRVPVLIQGESGTGKELLARAIHDLSDRKGKPFTPVNCAAIPSELFESEFFGHVKGAFTGADRFKPGLFEIAQEGTLFLDEIGEMSPALQAKLLRALESRTVRPVGGTSEIRFDVRVIAATNKDLEALVDAGRFREDLFYRLNVFHIGVPPLRERSGDLPQLADYFLAKIAQDEGGRSKTLTAETLNLLTAYPWPGNVRELENALRNAYVVCESSRIEAVHFRHKTRLFPGVTDPPENATRTLKNTLLGMQKQFIREALTRTHGNISLAARELGVARPLLSGWVKRWRLREIPPSPAPARMRANGGLNPHE